MNQFNFHGLDFNNSINFPLPFMSDLQSLVTRLNQLSVGKVQNAWHCAKTFALIDLSRYKQTVEGESVIGTLSEVQSAQCAVEWVSVATL